MRLARCGVAMATLAAGLLVACGGSGGATSDGAGDSAVEASDDVSEVEEPTGCDSGRYRGTYLVPGPAEEGFDPDLERLATQVERQFRAFNAAAMGLNTDVSISTAHEADRELITDFLREHEGWDFEAIAGKPAHEVITSQHKVAGLYAGVGAAADAYRYMVLRDQGYPCAEVERARQVVLETLEMLHTAVAITGAPGVIVRGLARKDLPGDGQAETLPLFDEQGAPLPEPKSNGAWREDFSEGGQYPNLIWEDSVSRDQYIGWVAAFGAMWEAIREDQDVPQALKDRLRADALAVGRQLMVVRASGYDLEIPDADGRTTLHGWMNEHNLDGKVYVDTLRNGFHAIMALGSVATFVYVTDDAELRAWLDDQLIGERKLHEIVRDEVFRFVDAGVLSNYSNYNMAFTGAWLALRYLEDPVARALVTEGLEDGLYDRPGKERQPTEFGYSLYDFVYAGGVAGQRADRAMAKEIPADAVARGVATLKAWRQPPYWDVHVENCPGWSCGAEPFVEGDALCAAGDGTTWHAMGCVGRNNDLVCEEPFLLPHLPPSNYHWRSNPYGPNGGGDGGRLLPSVDFRFAYWIGRVMRVSDLTYTIR